ncbi:Retrovirus-related Pol polyprotein from transposon TNT 1-94 [Vitis vinifera]|uniref:Retrovirus-related Pol polyprotein from transposon TNT 1-94 n=1 Tax=Vitis vinifera TaxID=29760 RepID=A0A438J3G5_VITVI|nr:Retrovirus-related Pol polyprotein from transposon TNT 1-94 [Vitis vinifera]
MKNQALELHSPLPKSFKVINFVDYSLNQGAPAGHESADTPIRHESYNQIGDCDGSSKFMAYLLVGCEISILPWRFERRDSDYAGDLNDRKNKSGYVFMMGTRAVSWSSKKQPIVTLSSTEVEFVAATACACQDIWLKKILKELHFKENEPTQIHYDNSSVIKLSKNPVLHG